MSAAWMVAAGIDGVTEELPGEQWRTATLSQVVQAVLSDIPDPMSIEHIGVTSALDRAAHARIEALRVARDVLAPRSEPASLSVGVLNVTGSGAPAMWPLIQVATYINTGELQVVEDEEDDCDCD